MFNKDKSVEDFVAKTIRPVIEEEQRKEEDSAKPIQTWKERWWSNASTDPLSEKSRKELHQQSDL